MIRLKLADESEKSGLMDAKAYEAKARVTAVIRDP